MSSYILVAETGADIPLEYVKKYRIAVVPMHVILDGMEYDDGTIPVERVFDHYRNTGDLPKTSGSTPHDFCRVFDKLHKAQPDAKIIHLAYSASTTCSYDSALTAAQGREYVTSIDTKSCSGGQAAVVLRIANLLEQTPDITLEDLISAVEDSVQRVRMAFFPGDLDYLRAGGRVSNAAYMGAQLLRLRPLIEVVNGKLIAKKKYRGSMAKVARKLLEEYPEHTALDGDRLILLYSEGLNGSIMDQMETLAFEKGFKDALWIKTGCVVSSHGGPGAFGIVGFARN